MGTGTQTFKCSVLGKLAQFLGDSIQRSYTVGVGTGTLQIQVDTTVLFVFFYGQLMIMM